MNTHLTKDSQFAPPSSGRRGKIILRSLGLLLLLGVFGMVGYSISVAIEEPDHQEIIILGQSTLASGNSAGLRIAVRNRLNQQPITGARVKLTLAATNGVITKLGDFTTDATGSLTEDIKIPTLPTGEYQLTVTAGSSLGRDHSTQKVNIQPAARLLLSSDKPFYQPGQIIHLRSLTLNRYSEKPLAGASVTFEIIDPKGNKVFKALRQTSTFGIVSADFTLATELNPGQYIIRALAGESSNELMVEVKNYVLPKFQVRIVPDKPYYLPGQTLTGTVRADYFFGKPVGQASVKLVVQDLQEKPMPVTELTGQTDPQGNFSFQFKLPDFFTGQQQNNAETMLDLTAEVRDEGGHSETKNLPLSVAQNDLEIVAIPEAGTWVPGLENQVYVLAFHPDGQPADCQVTLNGMTGQTDAQGLCIFKMMITDAHQTLEVQAQDPKGVERAFTYKPEGEQTAPDFLLRTDKPVYHAGETMQLTILATNQTDTLYLDVIKNGHIMVTKTIAPANRGAYALSLPDTLTGLLKLNAYAIASNGVERGCSRLVCVDSGSGLHIAGKLSKSVYRPGETARMDFTVTDASGRPTPAALGITVVDESLFALAESRSGLLSPLQEAEGDLLKPRYPTKFFDSPARFFAGKNPALATAYLASLAATPAGPTLEDMVQNGYLPPQLIQQVHDLMENPAYQKYRGDPEYAPAIRLLENIPGNYSLREISGPEKIKAVEDRQKAYFGKLRHYLLNTFLGLLFLAPVGLLIYYACPGSGFDRQALTDERTAPYLKFASAVYKQLALLTLFPFICYPAGFVLLGQIRPNYSGWVLPALEALLVLLALGIQYLRIMGAPRSSGDELAPLKVFLGVFLIQFIISRTMIVLMVLNPGPGMDLMPFWFLGSVIAPLVVLGATGSHIRRRVVEKGVDTPFAHIWVIEVLIIIIIVLVVGAMLLPALASAKRKSQSVSLLAELREINLANQTAMDDRGSSNPPRVRRDFPETLLWQPELITDEHGQATLEFPLADSITTWRATVNGINASGKMGGFELPIAVFQDFFVAMDMPAVLSLNDQVAVPLTCYNYLKEPQAVRLTVADASWFESSVRTFTLQLRPGEIKSVSLPLKALQVGQHTLSVTAQGTKMSDAIEREIRIRPTGRPVDYSRNEVLKNDFTDRLTLPAGVIPGSENLWVRFYPSHFSEVVEGLDSILQAPYGCFEQTSSCTYPNVLVLDYLQRTGKITPEIEAKARRFITTGYQRLLTFEVPGGGFEWFGKPPANVCLTAYGILEFTDMARVHPVEAAVAERARKWLYAQQNSDGSWSEINRGWTWSGRGSLTAFVAWALAESGEHTAGLDRALDYLRTHQNEFANTYTKVLAANALLAHDPQDALGRQLAAELKAAALVDEKGCLHWTAAGYSLTYSHDDGMATECTALAAMALMKVGAWPQSTQQALRWISTHKFADGSHGSTQATILCLRALLAASAASLGQQYPSTIIVSVNGREVNTFDLNRDNSDVMRQIDLSSYLQPGENQIRFQQKPARELPFLLSGTYWLPQALDKTVTPRTPEALAIHLTYDRTSLPVNDPLHCAVTIKNNTDHPINMVMADLEIPPGFIVDESIFEAMQMDGQIAKYEITGNQILLYLRELANNVPLQFNYSLRAKYPLHVQTPASSVYEYYQPQNRAISAPVMLQVSRN